MFVTVFYGILNTTNGEVEYVNAGHNPPYVLSNNIIVRKVEMTGGTILGCMKDFSYCSQKIQLNPGDHLLFLFTDGVTEAFNTKEELYGVSVWLPFWRLITQLQSKRSSKNLISLSQIFPQEYHNPMILPYW
jgi:serine phosphatase RsbU (regulator of sigma subunit)